MFNSLPTARLGVPPTVLDLLLDPAAPRPRRDVLARMLDDQVRRLIEGQPMLTLRFGRVAGEMLRKYARLGYVPEGPLADAQLLGTAGSSASRRSSRPCCRTMRGSSPCWPGSSCRRGRPRSCCRG